SDIPAEGSLLPETYYITRGTLRGQLVERMQKAQAQTLATLWAGRQKGLPIKSPYEALILASIIEKETGQVRERAHIAAVFHNRLRRNMRLQSDPTIIYGLTAGRGLEIGLGRPILRREIEKHTPYNTYRIDGLPPTPIANVGRAALLATLHPSSSRALYFVADGAGGHRFAQTLAEHNANVRAYRKTQQ
ncbi:MAG: endolytic transglycosylase MltG, partial [Alphaproteobacteria bacterium]|nr:endolytic transglycosylase MltG [Alphaproteobacteria bacterium]